MIDPALLGPYGLLTALLIAVAALWVDHKRSDADDRKERDDWKTLALGSQTDIRRLTAAVEKALGIKVSGDAG